ncbi:MAG: hypothetical protein V5B39_15815 [Accumulibacter sp.]|jgi:hypothetical protein|uniref:hypothetical protein n=1 Tax=Accumulibacter sp. TaxID=2053492 RepID=UPI002FC2E407
MVRSIVTTVPNAAVSLPALFSPTADASRRFVEFFTANIRNPNTRKTYARAASQFAIWCEEVALTVMTFSGTLDHESHDRFPLPRGGGEVRESRTRLSQ